jgi:hypothetical protein
MKAPLLSLLLVTTGVSSFAADPPRTTPRPLATPTAVPNFTPRVQVQPGEIQIIALIDGITELHVTKTGLFWVNGMYAKPGMHEPGNFPTYINGQPWIPRWHKPGTRRGVDTCDPFALPVPSLDLDLELIAVGEKPDAKGIEPRSPITVSRNGDELIVTIPEPEWGSRWYNFALVPLTKK